MVQNAAKVIWGMFCVVQNLKDPSETTLRYGIIQLQGFWDRLKSLKTDEAFTTKYRGIAELLFMPSNKRLVQVHFWVSNTSYRCSIFKKWDITLTLEKHDALLKLPLFKWFSNLPPKVFLKIRDPLFIENYLAKLFYLEKKIVAKSTARNGSHRCIPKDIMSRRI